MSEPMRFDLKHFGQISTMEVAKDGEFVLHSDYDRLKAEVERLEKQVNNLITSLQKSHDEHAKALYKLKYKK